MSYAEDLCEKSILLVFKDCKGLIKNYRPDFLKNPKTGRNLEIDLYLPSIKVGFEIQGQHHFEDSKQKKYDALKLKLAQEAGVDIIRLSLSQVGPKQLHKICKKILYPHKLKHLNHFSPDWLNFDTSMVKPHIEHLQTKYGKSQECFKSPVIDHDSRKLYSLAIDQFGAHLNSLPIIRAERKGLVVDVKVIENKSKSALVKIIATDVTFFVKHKDLMPVNQSLVHKIFRA